MGGASQSVSTEHWRPLRSPSSSPNWDPETEEEASSTTVDARDGGEQQAVSQDARAMHAALQNLEAADGVSDEMLTQLGRLLFKRRKVLVGGALQTYVAPPSETYFCLKQLLQRRADFMAARGRHDGPGDASQLASGTPSSRFEGRYVFTDEERRDCMREWRQEYAATPEQQELQRRDSLKSITRGQKGTGKGKSDIGPIKDAKRQGMHSRFARHLQRLSGSKQFAEIIVFTGSINLEVLQRAAGGASQPARETRRPPTEQQTRKRAALEAKCQYKLGESLARRISARRIRVDELNQRDSDLLKDFRSGVLLERLNLAVVQHGHGTLRQVGGRTLQIGGSSGGMTRSLLDGWEVPNVASFF